MKEFERNKFVEGFYNGIVITVISLVIGKILSNLYLNTLSDNHQLTLIISSLILVTILFIFWIKIFKKFNKELNS